MMVRALNLHRMAQRDVREKVNVLGERDLVLQNAVRSDISPRRDDGTLADHA